MAPRQRQQRFVAVGLVQHRRAQVAGESWDDFWIVGGESVLHVVGDVPTPLVTPHLAQEYRAFFEDGSLYAFERRLRDRLRAGEQALAVRPRREHARDAERRHHRRGGARGEA